MTGLALPRTRTRRRRPKPPNRGDLLCLAYSVFLVVMALGFDFVGEVVMLGAAAWAMSLTLRGWNRAFTEREAWEWAVMVWCGMAACFL